jgi:hypothetical protein
MDLVYMVRVMRHRSSSILLSGHNNIESDMLGSIARLMGQFFLPTMIHHVALAKNAERSSKMYICGKS